MSLPKRAAALLAAGALTALPASAGTIVAGYLPTYKGPAVRYLTASRLDTLTQVNVAFLNPDPGGDLVRDGELTCVTSAPGVAPIGAGDLRDVVQLAHAHKVKVVASLAGGVIPACAGDWNTLLAPDNRTALVAHIVDLAKAFDLDGIDIDLEWKHLTDPDDAGHFVPFIRELRDALHANHMTLSCATNSRPGGMIPDASIALFDHIGLMSYDAVGPGWGIAGSEHATTAMARQDIGTWERHGAKKDQILLGVPFYGYGFGALRGDYGYDAIIARYGAAAADADLIGQACATCDYITYNGRATVAQKAALARQKTAGLMIWDITGDADAPNSLLSVIADTLAAPATVDKGAEK